MISFVATRIRAIFVVLGLVLPTSLAWAQSGPGYSFGVLNQQSPALTAERWNPILRYVGEKAGVTLTLSMGATVHDTDAAMGRGEYDFMFTNHNFQSEFERVPYMVIARWKGEPIRGVIVVREESPVRALADLGGKSVAFPSSDAFVAYAVPIVAFKTVRVTVNEIFAGNQDGALARLALGQVDGAAVNSRFLADFLKRRPFPARIIHQSEGFPDLAVIAHVRVPLAVAHRVRDAMLGMHSDPAAAEILTRAQSRGFDAATNADYRRVREVYKAIGQ